MQSLRFLGIECFLAIPQILAAISPDEFAAIRQSAKHDLRARPHVALKTRTGLRILSG